MRIRLADVVVLESSAPDEDGEIHVRFGSTFTEALDLVIDAKGADIARMLAAKILGAAENRQPRGYELILPETDLEIPNA